MSIYLLLISIQLLIGCSSSRAVVLFEDQEYYYSDLASDDNVTTWHTADEDADGDEDGEENNTSAGWKQKGSISELRQVIVSELRQALASRRCGRAPLFKWNFKGSENAYDCNSGGYRGGYRGPRPLVADDDDVGYFGWNESLAQRMSMAQRASPGQYPSYVRLEMKEFGSYRAICGGTLISDRLVATAAHCLGPRGAFVKDLRIIAGIVSTKDRTNNQVSYVKGACKVPGRQTDFDMYDFAILVLAKPIKRNNFVYPACLPTRRRRNNPICFAVGMGQTVAGGSMSDQLNTMAVKLYCDRGQENRQDTTCFRAVAPFKGLICRGDSGSPIICLDNCSSERRQVAIGAMAFLLAPHGLRECQQQTPSKYTYLADFGKSARVFKNLLGDCRL